MDLSNLSSNWKSLQKKLSAGKSPSTASSSESRKRKITADDSMNDASAKGQFRHRSKSTTASNSRLTRNKATDESPSRPATSHASHSVPSLDLRNEGVSTTAFPGKYIALDCEMVGVGPPPHSDHQLARVSLVNWHGEQVYDSFVSPRLPVADYRTSVSGIRPSDLREGRPFSEVRADVSVFLKSRILVGHWLKSDLECLQISYPKADIRDTAKLEKFMQLVGGGNVKLKDIAKKVLGLDVQTGEHDSVEDARTAMLLFKAEREEFEGEKKTKKHLHLAHITTNGNPEEIKTERKRRKKKRR
jgi:RNA exonuclease 4